MNLKVCICDDEPVQAQALSQVVLNWASDKDFQIEFVFYNMVAEFELSRVASFDIIFMDVVIGNDLGFDITKKIRRVDPLVPIIFVTGYERFSLDCHGLMALDYLVKPVKTRKCFSALDRALHICIMRKGNMVSLNSDKFIIKEITYCEASKHNTIVHQINQTKTVALPMLEVAKALPQREFFRCHRSFIVHWLYARQATRKTVTMLDDTTIPVSRELASECTARFFAYHRIGL